MEPDDLTLEESMKECLFYLRQAAHPAAMDADQAFLDYGAHRGVAWELRQDLLMGSSLLGWTGLPVEFRPSIENLIAEVSRLPEAALQGENVSALHHRAWVSVRLSAERFLAATISFGEGA